ncbi:hypothetical protein EOA60_06960 [Mesorhizobium sp. M1A.F.Ca.IN.020.06.1.1]|uniref:hypothetical protein n=1 Tax=unclassified Mesorhizobium TaxID=325217 RepID=UPI000FCBD68C|nr:MULTISPECIES: hypothetical protein [unclassified Mesorhizobium]RUV81780.1 hypothetical protein EOA51_30370 [Mesorhizobium sp. M1A.F.Ca.IN.020.32.1.1]RUW04924.1 hypothetical protein EOA46_29830 [Mesorhizobium sp. M1A.F.Ca.IN.022.05.2.1]RUW33915.1 hypothetical protein EOA60_06960 [Mesorhizobium sp. M1A.F.Ca.IN.020.06.1.1]RWF82920.1 MAG: hypothetical protein EOQ35_08365 [Mesorhizobium sp.]RWG05684.1 MAG: hypothetical protein EOQ38_03340 [Mesorhizobium sp.]
MSEFSLYGRMLEHGTLAEEPNDVPDARFALPSAIHWIRALAIASVASDVGFATASRFYASVQRRVMTDREINTVCEQMLFALHQIAALTAIELAPNKADVARIGIVAWYYGVYGAASAMIAAGDGSFPDTHAATAQQWDRQFAATGLVMPPFADRISNLTDAEVKRQLAVPRSRGKHSLTVKPVSDEQGWGCIAEYLAGTADWEQWNIRERVRASREFRDLGVDSFRTSAARRLRDAAYAKRSIAFLHQASRYRGKANYRDAIYLGYGKSVPKLLDTFVGDLTMVLRAFSCMAAGYCAARLGRKLWAEFIVDLEAKRAISVSPSSLWAA